MKSIKKTPKIPYNHIGISGSQFKIPKLLATTQSDDLKNKNAKGRLTNIVVNVKNMLGTACFHFL